MLDFDTIDMYFLQEDLSNEVMNLRPHDVDLIIGSMITKTLTLAITLNAK